MRNASPSFLSEVQIVAT